MALESQQEAEQFAAEATNQAARAKQEAVRADVMSERLRECQGK